MGLPCILQYINCAHSATCHTRRVEREISNELRKGSRARASAGDGLLLGLGGVCVDLPSRDRITGSVIMIMIGQRATTTGRRP